jgi:adenosylmethionine-8-amino-7-oxononanoate aminotransferase
MTAAIPPPDSFPLSPVKPFSTRNFGKTMPSPANALDPAALLAFDREHIWHPYTSALHPLTAYEVIATSGCRIHLRGGRSLVDGMASWWCAIHGYNHPRLLEALRLQAETMPHVMFGGLTHAPAVSLAQRLLQMAPPSLEQVFFADSGSVAVEVAMKMALQYQRAGGKPGKSAFLTVRGGYHGDTLGAMSVCDPETGMHSLFSGTLPVQHFAPRPACPFDAPAADVDCDDLERLFAEQAEHAAAFIIEPIVQGAGGMWMYHPRYLARAGELCREYDCLLILDEIATGFGRTGRLFACEWAEVEPDIMCVGKALTGGVMSLAATLTSKEVAEGISADGGVLMHGPTFMGNPLACAVALASLELLEEEDWKGRVRSMESQLRTGLSACRHLPGVADARALGAIGVLEMEAPVDVERLQAFFIREHGVWIRPFGRLIYIMPPYVITPEELAMLLRAMREAVERGVWR